MDEVLLAYQVTLKSIFITEPWRVSLAGALICTHRRQPQRCTLRHKAGMVRDEEAEVRR